MLIVSGHDPSDGAGIAADRDAVDGLDLDVLEVITAWTDQDARAVRSIGPRDPAQWLDEATTFVRGGVAAVKLGLLPGAAHVRAACTLVRELGVECGHEFGRASPLRSTTESSSSHASFTSTVPFVVVDPVLRASSGARFVDDEGVEAIRGELCGLGVVLTPNLHEAGILACLDPLALERSLDRRAEAARILLALGARAVLIKGGHGTEDPVLDLIAVPDQPIRWRAHSRIAGSGIRGSGCRYASRLCARLALGWPLAESAADAASFVAHRIECALDGGR